MGKNQVGPVDAKGELGSFVLIYLLTVRKSWLLVYTQMLLIIYILYIYIYIYMNISHLFLRETKRSGDTAVRRIPKRALAI